MTRRVLPKADLLAVIAVGGALGAIARYELVLAVPTTTNGMPWGTFIANQTGAFVLGLFATVVTAPGARAAYLRAFVAIGVLGAYTTFSSLAMETVLLIKNGHAGLGLIYLTSTIAIGFAVATFGVACGRSFNGARR